MGERQLVICIDDDPPVLAAIRRLLRREPYDVVTTEDPQEVLKLVAERDVGLIVADQRMPTMMGTELLKQVRRCSPRTVCVILTGHADLSDIAGAMNERAVDRLIKKPWDDEDFRRMIRELLDRRSSDSPPVSEGDPRDEAAPQRVVRTVECAGRKMRDILTEVSGALYLPPTPPARIVLVFDHILRVEGSLTQLLAELVRLIVRSGTRAALVDGSGTAGAFLELVGGSLPVVVYRSEEEMSPPKRLLIVEDQEDSLEFLRALLESAGHRCEAVNSAREAVNRLAADAFDLVLLDLVLPDADGIEVARHVLERSLKIPIIAVSGFLDRWANDSFSRFGIRRQLSKPYRAREILDAIRDS